MVRAQFESVTGTHRVNDRAVDKCAAAAINRCGTTSCVIASATACIIAGATACVIAGATACAGRIRTTAPARARRNSSRGSGVRARRAAAIAGAGGSRTRRSRTPGRNDSQITDHGIDCRSVPKPDPDRRVDLRPRDRRARSRRHVLLHARRVATRHHH